MPQDDKSEKAMTIKSDVDRFIDYANSARGVARVKINCTEKHARRVFDLKKDQPLIYREVELVCEKQSRRARKKALEEAARLERETQTDAFAGGD
jgi:hypothetical protein